MSNLKYWQSEIKRRRYKTEFRDFLKEITSWLPFLFYKNNGLVSRFSKSSWVKICSIEDFEENRDQLINNGLLYNFENKFFNNFKSLLKTVTLPSLFHYWSCDNCDFSDSVLFSNNSYLSNTVIKDCENIFYSFIIRDWCENVFNSLFILNNSNNIYSSRWINSSYKVFFSAFIKNSSDIWFSSNLTWCRECIFCDNLQNSSYFIENKKYTKDEYLIKKSEILKNKTEFSNFYKNLKTKWNNNWSLDINWEFILDSENISNWKYVNNTKNAKNVIFVWSPQWNENFLDTWPWWAGWWNDFYAVSGVWDWSNNIYCSSQIWASSRIFYSYYLESCSFCIWCIWLKNKQYCILNKQYTKEEWEVLADKIFSQMEEDWILWDFFPW